jgi:hypothetical protein
MLTVKVLGRTGHLTTAAPSAPHFTTKLPAKKIAETPEKIFDSRCDLSNLPNSMNILRPSIYAIALTSLALSGVNAQTTATTDPVGFQSTPVPVGTSSLGNPLVNANVVQAGASANTSSIITLTGVTNAGALLTAGEPYYVEVVDGALEGERFDVDTAATITAGNATVVLSTSSPNNTSTLSPSVVVGSSIALRKHVTIEQLQTYFSPGLTGNNNFALADQISLYNPAGGILTSYFLRGDNVTWRQVGTTTTANKFVVASGTGFFVTKRNSATSFTSVGTVRMNDFAFPMPAGGTFRAPGFPVSYSPSSLGGTSADGWTGNNNFALADQLQVFNPVSGIFTSYFLRGDGLTWRQVGTTTTVTTQQLFADNNGFLVLRRNADQNYILVNPVVQ